MYIFIQCGSHYVTQQLQKVTQHQLYQFKVHWILQKPSICFLVACVAASP